MSSRQPCLALLFVTWGGSPCAGSGFSSPKPRFLSPHCGDITCGGGGPVSSCFCLLGFSVLFCTEAAGRLQELSKLYTLVCKHCPCESCSWLRVVGGVCWMVVRMWVCRLSSNPPHTLTLH